MHIDSTHLCPLTVSLTACIVTSSSLSLSLSTIPPPSPAHLTLPAEADVSVGRKYGLSVHTLDTKNSVVGPPHSMPEDVALLVSLCARPSLHYLASHPTNRRNIFRNSRESLHFLDHIQHSMNVYTAYRPSSIPGANLGDDTAHRDLRIHMAHLLASESISQGAGYSSCACWLILCHTIYIRKKHFPLVCPRHDEEPVRRSPCNASPTVSPSMVGLHVGQIPLVFPSP